MRCGVGNKCSDNGTISCQSMVICSNRVLGKKAVQIASATKTCFLTIPQCMVSGTKVKVGFSCCCGPKGYPTFGTILCCEIKCYLQRASPVATALGNMGRGTLPCSNMPISHNTFETAFDRDVFELATEETPYCRRLKNTNIIVILVAR